MQTNNIIETFELSEVEKFLIDEKYLKHLKTIPRSDEKQYISHNDLNGGKLYIPDNLMNDFYKAYAKDWDKKIYHSFSENAYKNCFKFFIDVDLQCKSIPEFEQINNLVKLIQDQIKLFYSEIKEETLTCFVLSRDPNKTLEKGFSRQPNLFESMFGIQKGNQPNWKCGYHLIFPYLITNVENVVYIHAQIIHELYRRKDIKIEKCDGWEQIIDSKCYVYGFPHLRMLGSINKNVCKSCKTPGNILCKFCNGRNNREDLLKKIYHLSMIIDGSGNPNKEKTEELQNDTLELVKFATIRTPINTSITRKFKLFKNCPPPYVNISKSRLYFNIISLKTELSKIIRDLVKNFQHNKEFPYKNCRVSDIYKQLNGYVVEIDGPNATYCTNINGNHNSAKAYFKITETKGGVNIYSLCHCTHGCKESISNNRWKDRSKNEILCDERKKDLFHKESKKLKEATVRYNENDVQDKTMEKQNNVNEEAKQANVEKFKEKVVKKDNIRPSPNKKPKLEN